MDCSDRIAFLTHERTLERVRTLRGAGAGPAITVRVHSMMRRFDVTIREQPAGETPTYGWELSEVDSDGAVRPGGIRVESASTQPALFDDPEEAYWCASEAIAEAATPASPARPGRRGDDAASRPRVSCR